MLCQTSLATWPYDVCHKDSLPHMVTFLDVPPPPTYIFAPIGALLLDSYSIALFRAIPCPIAADLQIHLQEGGSVFHHKIAIQLDCVGFWDLVISVTLTC